MFKRLGYRGFIFLAALIEIGGRGYAGQILLNKDNAIVVDAAFIAQTTSAPHEICETILLENRPTTQILADFGLPDNYCLDPLQDETAAQFDYVD